MHPTTCMIPKTAVLV